MDDGHTPPLLGPVSSEVSSTLGNIGLILVFILVGSMFAAAEIALVSLRESQVRGLAGRGRRGAAVARLAKDPNRFLAAVQVGVTLAGFLSASFGGVTLSGDLAPHLVDLGLPKGAADVIALVLVTVAISYFSLVLGELAPEAPCASARRGLRPRARTHGRPRREDLASGDLAAVGVDQRGGAARGRRPTRPSASR